MKLTTQKSTFGNKFIAVVYKGEVVANPSKSKIKEAIEFLQQNETFLNLCETYVKNEITEDLKNEWISYGYADAPLFNQILAREQKLLNLYKILAFIKENLKHLF